MFKKEENLQNKMKFLQAKIHKLIYNKNQQNVRFPFPFFFFLIIKLNEELKN